MSKSKIEWTDETWNPVTGCTKVSAGCKHCYAEREWPRMVRLVPSYAGRDFTDVRCHPERLEQPLHWKRPRRVFVNSMSDLFHESVPDDFIIQVFGTMALAQQHTFQVLTKRPARMRELLSSFDFLMGVRDEVKYEPQAVSMLWPLSNVHLGVSVEDQPTADERSTLLLQTPAAVRWISAEPLLGPVDASRYMWPVHARWPAKYLSPEEAKEDGAAVEYRKQALVAAGRPFVNWVVVGGESGPKARPMSPDWARSLRDQCAAAGVPFLFKQWGEWIPMLGQVEGVAVRGHATTADGWVVGLAGKKAAGRLLDGVQHDGYPEIGS